MDKKTIYIILGIIILSGIILFFVLKKPATIIPKPAPKPIEPSPSPEPSPEPIPKNELEKAYYLSRKMNKDTDDLISKLCNTLNAKTLFPDIC